MNPRMNPRMNPLVNPRSTGRAGPFGGTLTKLIGSW